MTTNPALETIIIPKLRDLGDFSVRRALPAAQRQRVGPFIFFDQFGPTGAFLGAVRELKDAVRADPTNENARANAEHSQGRSHESLHQRRVKVHVLCPRR